MPSIRLHIPRSDVFDFQEDLTAWASESGVDPRLTIVTDPRLTTNPDSSTLYEAFVDDRFFEQFPRWHQFIEH